MNRFANGCWYIKSVKDIWGWPKCHNLDDIFDCEVMEKLLFMGIKKLESQD